jgi:SCO1/SenC
MLAGNAHGSSLFRLYRKGYNVKANGWQGSMAKPATCMGRTCPKALFDVSAVFKELAADKKVAALPVTVYRERDTPDILNTYLANFDSRVIGLTGPRRPRPSSPQKRCISLTSAPICKGRRGGSRANAKPAFEDASS